MIAGKVCFIVLVTLTLGFAQQEKSDIFQETVTNGADTMKYKNCQVNGVHLRHRSMKYYGENAYVACSHGKASCYLIERVHTHATEVACPLYDLQERIDFETALREKKEKIKQQSQDEDESDDRRLSLVVVSTTRIWDGGVLCYQYNHDYPFKPIEREYIYKAMGIYENNTNVRFVTTATCKKEKMKFCDSCANWVDFKHPPTGRDCNSSIGITEEGPQIMNLAGRCFEVDDDLKTVYGSAMHEIGHSLGLYHEHQHPKRSIGIFWEEIDQSIWAEMSIRDLSVGGPYDLDSVMHYPQTYGFCQPTYCDKTVTKNCVPKGTTFCNLNDDQCTEITREVCNEAATKAVGQRKYLSKGDIAALNELYPTPAWPSSKSKMRE
ncbi:metalloprotease family [Plasmopara halstedii]|uniref:Metalloendopeptidase n=1 Tax=Plasmopara halstedii TaxID=4781 RepID=A0A0P1B175_PLAHL|nr:metalloprotease family [Plasmopara halstedii]CEG48423.1 metalloprotease family [Plasmopara halstedii]|eukprot:XP_024584792.1 metalloprotease family [Plasmopara halstedii]